MKKAIAVSNKTLQNFTKIDREFTVTEFKEYLKENPTYNDREWMLKALNNSQKNEDSHIYFYTNIANYCEALNLTEDAVYYKRAQWQRNDYKIRAAINKILLEYHRAPTYADIEKITKLSRPTITSHMKAGIHSEAYKENMSTYQQLIPVALAALYQIGINTSNVKALNSFLRFATIDKQAAETKSINNNYIQINNLKFDAKDLEQLPPNVLNEIETILIAAKSVKENKGYEVITIED